MTNALRYQILKRDGFRCQICGRSQEDGVILHIHDEIVDTMYDKGYTSIPDTVCNVYKTNRRGTRRIKNV